MKKTFNDCDKLWLKNTRMFTYTVSNLTNCNAHANQAHCDSVTRGDNDREHYPTLKYSPERCWMFDNFEVLRDHSFILPDSRLSFRALLKEPCPHCDPTGTGYCSTGLHWGVDVRVDRTRGLRSRHSTA